eukprot:221106-Rhodomonas_salina.1
MGDMHDGSGADFEHLMSGGGVHACFVNQSRLVCWGSDELGNTNPPSGEFKAVSAGSWHTCALDSAGKVVCFGSGYALQGDPAPEDELTALSAGKRSLRAHGSRPSGHACIFDTYSMLFGRVCTKLRSSRQRWFAEVSQFIAQISPTVCADGRNGAGAGAMAPLWVLRRELSSMSMLGHVVHVPLRRATGS